MVFFTFKVNLLGLELNDTIKFLPIQEIALKAFFMSKSK